MCSVSVVERLLSLNPERREVLREEAVRRREQQALVFSDVDRSCLCCERTTAVAEVEQADAFGDISMLWSMGKAWKSCANAD